MPFGTAVTALQPTVAVSAGAAVSPASGVAVNFTGPVTYTVTSESDEERTWTVTCVVDPNTANHITSFTVPGQVSNSDINTTDYTVTFHMPYGTVVTALQPTVEVSENATVVYPDGGAPGDPVDFTSVVTYIVYAESNTVPSQEWTVTCVVDPNTTNDITGFRVPGQVGDSVIDAALHTVTFTVPYGTVITGLEPQLTIPEQASVMPASGAAVDFSNSTETPVPYTVTAGSGTPQTWNVTCNVENNTANDIVSYTVPGQIGSSVINTTDHTVLFYLLPGTNVANLEPTIQISGDAEIEPQSGIHPNFNNGSALYVVTAQSGARQIWIVSYRIYYNPQQEPESSKPKTPDTQQEKLEKAVVESKKNAAVQAMTGNAVSVGSKSAVLTGIILAGGGEMVQIGFRYRAVGEAGWSYTGVQALPLQDGQGFSAEAKGLKPNTSYEFEARAANLMGMSEGGVLTFTTEKAKAPKVQTLSAAAGDLGAVRITGAVIDDGGDTVKDAGFLWGVSPGNLSQQSLGTAMQLSLALKDLKVGSTLYYQAYAENSGGMATGDLRTYKVPGLIVTTLAATGITKDGATLQGKITGDDMILESGFTISPAINASLKATADKDGNFKVTVHGLKSGTKYYFIAYAKTAENEYGGQVMEFTPQSDIPEVETYEAKDIGRIMANLGGYITKNKGFPILDCGFYWGQDPNPDQKVSVTTAEDIRTMEFRLVGLKANTTYYYKAFAENKNGTGFGEVISFTTDDVTPPVVTSVSAAYDGNRKQWVLVGSIGDDGGENLAEYGFRMSGDSESWTDLPVGFDLLGDFVSRGLPVFRDLQPGTYSAKAYAINSAGTGEGDELAYVVPSLPRVKTAFDQESIDLDKSTLQGSVIDTGAAGVYCYATQFKYRKAGETEWQVAGTAAGEIGVSDFSFALTGLTPGAKYEFMAEAENSYGTASGEVAAFTMNYGKTAQQAVSYLIGTERPPADIADILKAGYQCSLDDCVQILYENRYSYSDITAAMTSSSYQAKHRDLAVSLKNAGISALELAQVLLSDYKEPLRLSGNSIETELILTLKGSGFDLADNVHTLVSLFGYDAAGVYGKFYTGQLSYSEKEIQAAISEVLGFDPLLDFLWARSVNWMNTQAGWGQLFQVLDETAGIMREIGKMESAAIGEK